MPLDTVCENADAMNRTISDTIQQGIKDNAYPQGLRKQYELQLRMLQEKVPNLELALAPGPIAAPGEYIRRYIIHSFTLRLVISTIRREQEACLLMPRIKQSFLAGIDCTFSPKVPWRAVRI